MLGDRNKDMQVISPIRGGDSMSERETKLKQLVDKIAFDVWEADHQLMISLQEAERLRTELTSPRYMQVRFVKP